jgi:hypothetical protein
MAGLKQPSWATTTNSNASGEPKRKVELARLADPMLFFT